MIVSRQARWKWYALRVLAIVLVVAAAIAFSLWRSVSWIHSLGLLAIFVSLGLVRISNNYLQRMQGQVEGVPLPVEPWRRVGLRAWIITGASLLVVGILCLAMYVDGFYGGNEGWLAYLCGGAVMVFATSAGYVVAKLFQ